MLKNSVALRENSELISVRRTIVIQFTVIPVFNTTLLTEKLELKL